MADGRTGRRVKNNRTSSRAYMGKSLDKLFALFYEAKVSEGRSDRTVETYEENYKFFCDYLDSNSVRRDADFITAEVIRGYITWMLKYKKKWDGHKNKAEHNMTVGLSPVTVNTRLKPLRTMFKFLLDEGRIDVNPFELVKKVKEPEVEIKIMSIEQLKNLLKAPNQRTYAGFRDYVMMNVLIDSFMRIGEVLSLKASDIDFAGETLTLNASITKSRRTRVVPLQNRTIKLINELIEECQEFQSDYLFLTNYGEPLTDDQFRGRLKEHARKAGLNIRIYPHLFRHTAATMFLEGGGDVRHLQLILGHRDLAMIERYTHLSKKSIKTQHDLYSPMNQLIDKHNKPRTIMR